MDNTATILAHILFRDGAVLNISTVLRNLDHWLDPASDGAYQLNWDSEDVMVAQFGRSRVILIAGHKTRGGSGFSLTIAISPVDEDAIADPNLARQHNRLIKDLVASFTQSHWTSGVLWQRSEAPVTVEVVERMVEGLGETLDQVAPGDLIALAHVGAGFHTPTAVGILPNPGVPIQGEAV